MKKRRKKPLKIADSKECSEKYKTNERTEFGFYSETSMKILFMATFHEHLWWHIAQYKKIVKSQAFQFCKLYVLGVRNPDPVFVWCMDVFRLVFS